MAALLWTLEDAQRFTSEVKGLRLAVMPAKIEGFYRYQVFKRSSDSSVYASISSGHCTRLREAQAAAEAAAIRIATAK